MWLADINAISLTPILINRAVLSIKRAADIGSKDTQAWSTVHFQSARFKQNSTVVTSETPASQPPEESMEARVNADDHDDIPLDELAFDQRAGLCSLVTSENTV